MIAGWYYIHENGSLIYKNYPDACIDIRDSDFCIGLWPADPENREFAWNLLVEVFSTGLCPKERILELAKKWNCDDEDAEVYAERVGCVLEVDGLYWCAHKKDFVNLHESPAGFGETKLEAMAELCKALGYRPAKMWGNGFRDLLKLS